MHLFWQHRQGRAKLVVFCNGWGMDPNPFAPLGANDHDVLHLYDFRELTDLGPVLTIMADYDERILLGWSMGVWGGQRLFADHVRLFSRTIAVNGTLCPVNDRFGIPQDLFAGTMAGWSEVSRRKFYHRLAGGGEVERIFLRHQPRRALADQQDELAYYLANANCAQREESIYREILVSERDKIVPTANQLAYWGEGVVELTGGHFPFYRWNDWDELLTTIHLNVQ